MIDETTISKKKYIHVFMGKLADPKFIKLVGVKIVENTNSDTIVYQLDDILRQLSVERQNMILLLSDAAAYMKLAGEKLKVSIFIIF